MRISILAVALGLVGCTSEPLAEAGDGHAGSGGAGTGPPATPCSGSVTFRLEPTADRSTRYCLGPPTSCDLPPMVAIRDSSGVGLLLFPDCPETECLTCQPIPCSDGCIRPPLLPQDPIEFSWHGISLQRGSTCGDGLECVTPECAPPGSYVASFCANRVEPGDAGVTDGGNGDCQYAASTPSCVEVPFEYPGATFIKVVFDPT